MHGTRPLGATGLEVSPIGLGLAALGRPGYINLGHEQDMAGGRDPAEMETRCYKVLDAAWRQGVRYFDAARSYGLAEHFLGNWLRAHEPATTIGSKWGYTYTADWQVKAEVHEVKDHSHTVFSRQLTETRQALGNALNLYQIHSATLESGVLENHEVLAALSKLRETGVRIGFTTSGPRQGEVIERALAIEIDGRRLFDTVQATWNLLEPSAGPQLAAARHEGVGVIVKEALANGRLTGRNQTPEFADRRRHLEQAALEVDASLDALALAAVLAQPWADVVLSGAASVSQLESNLSALYLSIGDQAEALLGALAEPAEQYWRLRAGLTWN